MAAIVILLVVGVVLAVWLARKGRSVFGRSSAPELGTLSHHWIAEQRLGQKHDVR